MDLVKTFFFLSVFMVIYIYCGYPLVLSMLAGYRRADVRKGNSLPRLTILISAYNEEECIEATLRNKLSQDYPQNRLEIIVVSDGSTDRTDEIVRSLDDSRVKLIRQEPRAGKTAALNRAAREARGEILVFADANSIYAPDALRMLVRSFDDPTVGYVTGKMIYNSSGASPVGDGCSGYMRYENFLRELETQVGSVVGVDGGIDAVRRNLYVPMRPDQLPDFVLPLQVVKKGFRAVYEPQAVLRETALESAEDEYRMRVRVALRAFWALYDMRVLLNPWRYGLFAWQLWSHKVLRYGCFLFLIAGGLLNGVLAASGWIYLIVAVAQGALYAGALVSPLTRRINPRLRMPYWIEYFLLLNLACGHAFLKFILGRKQVLWTPRKG